MEINKILNKPEFKYSALSAGIFILLSLPSLYQKVNLSVYGIESTCPVWQSRILHTILMFAIIVLSMAYFSGTMMTWKAWKPYLKPAIIGALMFFFVSSGDMYRLTSLLKSSGNPDCPSMTGILTHGAVYGALVYYYMKL